MSPEQAQGLELDGRSDLYSLGAVGFTLLQEWIATTTGKPAKIVKVVRPRFRRSKPVAEEDLKEGGGLDA